MIPMCSGVGMGHFLARLGVLAFPKPWLNEQDHLMDGRTKYIIFDLFGTDTSNCEIEYPHTIYHQH